MEGRGESQTKRRKLEENKNKTIKLEIRANKKRRE